MTPAQERAIVHEALLSFERLAKTRGIGFTIPMRDHPAAAIEFSRPRPFWRFW